MRTLTPFLLGGALVLALIGPAVAETTTTTTLQPAATLQPACPPMMSADPAVRAQMLAGMQDMMVMTQNTAVWTPQGLVVLQGNRLLHYNPNLQLAHQVTLPLPLAATAMGTTGSTTTTAGATTTTTTTTTMATLPDTSMLRSMVPVQIVPAENNSLVIVRGQQVLRYDRDFRLISQATLPMLPPLTVAEAAAICPACQSMYAMNSMMLMPAGSMTTTSSTTVQTGTGVATAP